MGLLNDIKEQVKKSGTNKGKFIYFKSGTKIRVRFLTDMEDGIKVGFHDSFQLSINVPCQQLFGRNCQHDENEELRHRDQFIWSVYNYESKETQLLMGAVNNASPIPQLVAMYETYGTLLDRDYVITKNGSGTTTTFSVVPMDKVKFKNDKAKPYPKKKVLELLDKAFPDEDSEGSGGKSSGSDEGEEYSDMTPKKLYDLCKERDIDVEPKKPKQYYIDKLEEADADNEAGDDWGEDEVEEPDYDSMSPKELYDLCIKKGIDVKPKKPKEHYIEQLKESNAGSDDEWGADEDEWD